MIYTLTTNPSIDVFMDTGQALKTDDINRAKKSAIYVGGKGLIVSEVLTELGISNIALGFIGGFTGRYVEDSLAEVGVNTDFIEVDGLTRINTKLKTLNDEIEMNEAGPIVDQFEIEKLYKKLNKLTPDDIVVMAGSLPPSLTPEFYSELAQFIREQGAEFIVDTADDKLLACLPYEPLLIKPNSKELSTILHQKFENPGDMEVAANKLLEMGAQNVILSLAGEGAMLFSKQGTYRGYAPKGKVKNSVGAGDSMVAGFLAEYTKGKDLAKAFKLSIAAGSATAFSEKIGSIELIKNLKDKVKIVKQD